MENISVEHYRYLDIHLSIINGFVQISAIDYISSRLLKLNQKYLTF